MMKIKVILMIFSLLQINITSQTVRKDFEIDTFDTMEIGDTIAIKQDGYIEVDSNQNYTVSTAESVSTTNTGTNMVNYNVSTKVYLLNLLIRIRIIKETQQIKIWSR